MKIWLKALITLLTIGFVLTAAVRTLITPLYAEVEYRMPGFPEDDYGFRFEERLYWARISIDYLLNSENISFLADQRLADGQPLYNGRELSHMLDVKKVVQTTLWSGYLIACALVGLWVVARRQKAPADFWQAVARGGLITILLVVLVLIGVAISFNQLFTTFHDIFFASGSWVFEYSDTLIRLFPIRFWQDAFAGFGLLSLLYGGLLAWLGRRLAQRKIFS